MSIYAVYAAVRFTAFFMCFLCLSAILPLPHQFSFAASLGPIAGSAALLTFLFSAIDFLITFIAGIGFKVGAANDSFKYNILIRPFALSTKTLKQEFTPGTLGRVAMRAALALPFAGIALIPQWGSPHIDFVAVQQIALLVGGIAIGLVDFGLAMLAVRLVGNRA